MEASEGRAVINPPVSDPPELSCNKSTTQAIQSMVQEPEQGTVNEASLLHFRIPTSHKGKQIERAESIHGGQQAFSLLELQP